MLNIEARGRGKVIAALTSEQVTAQLVGKTLKAEQQKSVVIFAPRQIALLRPTASPEPGKAI
ncbi:hypothetical protein [Escherichia coli]|uniref:hypothetical protein n=1 Tax=Escherichia coli TaxID=562 RepID=UPI00388E8F41